MMVRNFYSYAGTGFLALASTACAGIFNNAEYPGYPEAQIAGSFSGTVKPVENPQLPPESYYNFSAGQINRSAFEAASRADGYRPPSVTALPQECSVVRLVFGKERGFHAVVAPSTSKAAALDIAKTNSATDFTYASHTVVCGVQVDRRREFASYAGQVLKEVLPETAQPKEEPDVAASQDKTAGPADVPAVPETALARALRRRAAGLPIEGTVEDGTKPVAPVAAPDVTAKKAAAPKAAASKTVAAKKPAAASATTAPARAESAPVDAIEDIVATGTVPPPGKALSDYGNSCSVIAIVATDKGSYGSANITGLSYLAAESAVGLRNEKRKKPSDTIYAVSCDNEPVRVRVIRTINPGASPAP
ncbi:MAG: hypothetical protein WDO70_00860 [Alphaproteobacteria bacterium]